MPTHAAKAKLFRDLHERAGAFVIPNPWDIGTARLLAQLGFEALATTSAGLAFSRGRPEGRIDREASLAHAREIVEATDLPVSADLEGGFADEPESVAKTIELAAATGLAGASIEDYTGRPEAPIYDFDFAVERVRAAATAAAGLPRPFLLTARAENHLHGRPDLADSIRRLQAFQEAGAGVLYAPGLKRADEIATLVRAVDRPVNVVMGLQGGNLSVTELADLGVKRISVGSALSRAALGAFLRAAREILGEGSFTFADEAASFSELDGLFADWR